MRLLLCFALGRKGDADKRSRDGSRDGSLRRGQRMHDPEVALMRRSRPGPSDDNRYSGEFRRSRSERNLLKAGGGARGPTGSSTNLMDRSLGRPKRGTRGGAEESAPEESLGSRSSSSGSTRHKRGGRDSSPRAKAAKPLPPRPGSGRSGHTLKMSEVPDKRSSFAQGERDDDLYENTDFGILLVHCMSETLDTVLVCIKLSCVDG